MTSATPVLRAFAWRRFLAVAGPGVVVMLADTDAGSLITAAQSGAQWGYSLLLLQALLIPILYIVQELTVRLGMVTGKGHAELIKRAFWKCLGVGFGDHPDRLLHRRPVDRTLGADRRRGADRRAADGDARR